METVKDLYQELKDAGCEIDNHESDLYVKATMTSFNIIKAHGLKFDGIQAGQFWHQVTKQRWFEIPFCLYAVLGEAGHGIKIFGSP